MPMSSPQRIKMFGFFVAAMVCSPPVSVDVRRRSNVGSYPSPHNDRGVTNGPGHLICEGGLRVVSRYWRAVVTSGVDEEDGKEVGSRIDMAAGRDGVDRRRVDGRLLV